MIDWILARLIYLAVEIIEFLYNIPNLWRRNENR